MSGPPFWGKYRGLVTDIQDPLNTGRIRAKVDVLGDKESGWAMPCAPFGGDQTGFFALPKVGAGVWIEFERGDPDYPVWVGCWWGKVTDRPSDLLAPPYKKLMVKTEGGHTLTLDDSPGIGNLTLKTSGGHKLVLDDTPGAGGIVLETSTGAKLSITSTGIEITNGQGASLKLQGPQVQVNNGALEVT